MRRDINLWGCEKNGGFLNLLLSFSFLFSFSFVFSVFVHDVRGEPMDFFCPGPKSRMMGCSGIASSEGYEASYFNPSLLPAKKNLGIGFLYSSQDINVTLGGTKLSTLGNPIESVRQVGFGFSISLADLPFVRKGKLSENIYLGTSAFLPASKTAIRVTTFQSKIPSALLYGNRNTRFSVYGGAGVRFPLGNINIYAGGGAYTLANLPIIIDANISPDKDLLTVDGSLELSFAPVVGIALEFVNVEENPDLIVRLAGMYRGPIGLEIPIDVNAYLIGEQVLSLVSTAFFTYTPGTLGGGLFLKKKLGKFAISLGGDVLQMLFSEFKSPFLSVEKIEPQEIGQALPLASIEQPVLQNVLVGRGGIILDIEEAIGDIDVSVGGGGYYFPSPLKDVEQKSTFLVDGDRIAILGGLGVNFPAKALINGEIGIFFTGGVQLISKTTVKSNFGEAEVEGTLPIFSVRANLNF